MNGICSLLVVRLAWGSWRTPDLIVADGFWGRVHGIARAGPGMGVLIRTSSVHGIGLREPLATIGITDAGLVVGAKALLPGRVVWFRRAEWVAEIPRASMLPPLGASLELRARSAPTGA